MPASLHFSNLSYTLDNHAILDSITGAVKPGKVLAIMGASGAGKSTLLDILARRQKRGQVAGQILVNGRVVGDSMYRKVVGYVDQEDTLMSTLTVYETVFYSALLRLPREMSTEAKRFRTLETMNELGILHIRDSRIGEAGALHTPCFCCAMHCVLGFRSHLTFAGKRSISGGEKRRVSIACELVTSPSILFLDEPTSGLDAFNAYNVVECLHKLAREYKRTVIFTIHQPRSNIVSLFDRLIVLAKGKLVYSGDMQDCHGYFANIGYPCPPGFNIADYLSMSRVLCRLHCSRLSRFRIQLMRRWTALRKSLEMPLRPTMSLPRSVLIRPTFPTRNADLGCGRCCLRRRRRQSRPSFAA